QMILGAIFKEQGGIEAYVLTTADWEIIHRIRREKYQQWEWNNGSSPKFNITNSNRIPSGNVDVRLDVHHGLITEVHIYGDFFGLGDVKELEDALLAVQFNRTGIEAALQRVDVKSFLGQISKEEFVDLLVD